jgi:deazaflavin-dependent oxidoreductase (nitroreductase family)
MSTRQPRPWTPQEERRGNFFIKRMSAMNARAYKSTGGRIGGRFLKGAAVCLLTTIGRSSGLPRTMPLLFLRNGNDVVLVASKGGFSDHPQWYRNLLANPAVEIQIGKAVKQMIARVADDEEKAELWPQLVAMYADFEDYQARTTREIPVVICTPIGVGTVG